MKRAALFALLLVVALSSCKHKSRSEQRPELGNAERGRKLIIENGCYDCHTIPGIDRKPGPGVVLPLAGFASRDKMISKSVDVTRPMVEMFLQRPKSVSPRATMPGIGHNPVDARDMAAYLWTLD